MLLPPVHLVTDRRGTPDLAAAALRALGAAPAGALALHLREKDLGGRELLALVRVLAAACRERGQRFLVNDRLDVALLAGADGVHLPAAGVAPGEARRLLGPGRLVGVSCHGVDDVRAARDAGADYASFGPVFDTPSKRPYGPPLGLAALAEAAGLGLPLVALGGVDPSNAAAAFAAGARGVAAIRAGPGWPRTARQPCGPSTRPRRGRREPRLPARRWPAAAGRAAAPPASAWPRRAPR